VAVGIARKHVEDLPAQQVRKIRGRITRHVLEHPEALCEGRSPVFLVFFFMTVSKRLAEVFLVRPQNLSIVAWEAVVALLIV